MFNFEQGKGSLLVVFDCNNQNKFNSLRINIDDIETGEEGISPTIRQASSDL